MFYDVMVDFPRPRITLVMHHQGVSLGSIAQKEHDRDAEYFDRARYCKTPIPCRWLK